MNDKALLKTKGRLYVWDESAGVKALTEVTLVDNINWTIQANPVKLKSPSGVTVLSMLDPRAQVSFDWFNPADNAKLELMLRGAVENTEYDGETAQEETVRVSFRKAGEAFMLPGFNGAKTAVTVSAVKLASDPTTTYTVTDDYTVAVESATGMSSIVQVSDGDIPLNTDVLVTYSYTPLASTILKPVEAGQLVTRDFVIETNPDPTDLTKYRRYYLPKATIESDVVHQLLRVKSGDNENLNVLSMTFTQESQEEAQNHARWYIQDSYNV